MICSSNTINNDTDNAILIIDNIGFRGVFRSKLSKVYMYETRKLSNNM